MKIQAFGIALILALLTACASPERPSGRVENVVESRATITAVDRSRRLVTLRDASGQEIVVQVSDAVKNFDQVKVGDEVVVSHTEALAWQVKPAGQGAPGISTDEGVTTAKAGEKPSATAASSVTITATITAIDLAAGTVTLTGPGGKSRTIKARDPNNLTKVKIGDLVDITYTEAVAIAVKPVEK
jgi:hypothetical protein